MDKQGQVPAPGYAEKNGRSCLNGGSKCGSPANTMAVQCWGVGKVKGFGARKDSGRVLDLPFATGPIQPLGLSLSSDKTYFVHLLWRVKHSCTCMHKTHLFAMSLRVWLLVGAPCLITLTMASELPTHRESFRRPWRRKKCERLKVQNTGRKINCYSF